MHAIPRASRILFAAALSLAAVVPASAQGRVSGTVKDDAGQPIKGATIVAKNPQATPPDFTSHSDDKGRWSMIGLQNGPWVFTASADGYAPVETRTPVSYLRPNPPIGFTLARGTPGLAPGANAKELQAELKAADALMEARQWDQAIAAYQALLAKAPALTMVNLQVAVAYRQKKDWDRAIAAYHEVLKAEPGLERVVIELGNTYLQKGDLDRAEETFEAAAGSASAGRELFYNLGEVHFAKAQMDDAVANYQKAADRDPAWGKPLFKIGLVALNKGDKAGAIAMMEKVIAADPNSPEAVQARGLIEQLKK